MTDLPWTGQTLAFTDFSPSAGYEEPTARLIVENVQEANLVTSLVARTGAKMHKPVLDIDLPVTVLASSTPGHHHLFIDKEMTWERYKTLLDALMDAGLVESGYVNASRERGYTAVRLPWVRKEGGVVESGE